MFNYHTCLLLHQKLHTNKNDIKMILPVRIKE